MLHPNESIEQIVSITRLLIQWNNLGAAVLSYTDNQVDNARYLLENHYQGRYRSDIEFAKSYCDHAYGDNWDHYPSLLTCHVDYEQIAKVLFATDFFALWLDEWAHVFSQQAVDGETLGCYQQASSGKRLTNR